MNQVFVQTLNYPDLPNYRKRNLDSAHEEHLSVCEQYCSYIHIRKERDLLFELIIISSSETATRETPRVILQDRDSVS